MNLFSLPTRHSERVSMCRLSQCVIEDTLSLLLFIQFYPLFLYFSLLCCWFVRFGSLSQLVVAVLVCTHANAYLYCYCSVLHYYIIIIIIHLVNSISFPPFSSSYSKSMIASLLIVSVLFRFVFLLIILSLLLRE